MPPAHGFYKLNTDAATFSVEAVGLGGIIRDSCGDVILSTFVKVNVCFGAEIAEAMAAWHCLIVAIGAGLNKLTLETDCQKLSSYLKNRKSEPTYFGIIVADILHLSKACSFIYFAHIGRKGNGAAHILAHISVILVIGVYGLKKFLKM